MCTTGSRPCALGAGTLWPWRWSDEIEESIRRTPAKGGRKKKGPAFLVDPMKDSGSFGDGSPDRSATDGDPAGLPPGLPVPLEDGAGDPPAGIWMPSVRLRSRRGREVDIAEVSLRPRGRLCFPAAPGRPGMPKE